VEFEQWTKVEPCEMENDVDIRNGLESEVGLVKKKRLNEMAARTQTSTHAQSCGECLRGDHMSYSSLCGLWRQSVMLYNCNKTLDGVPEGRRYLRGGGGRPPRPHTTGQALNVRAAKMSCTSSVVVHLRCERNWRW
jgi:hypothetical protein